MKDLRINITEEDIKYGERGNPYQCPTALALKRIFPNGKVEVGSVTTSITFKDTSLLGRIMGTKNKRYYFRNSNRLRSFILGFDAYNDAKPQENLLLEYNNMFKI